MIKNVLRHYLKSEFSRNVFTLFSGTTIAQVIPLIVSPLLTRLYSPEDFGLLALFVSSFSIISIIVTLQYEAAIVLPKEESAAVNLVGLCFIITCCITVISLVLTVVLNKPIARWLGDPKISYWLYFVPIPVFLTGIYNTLNYWSIRKKKYKRLAVRTISQSTTTAALKVIFGFTKVLRSGLIVSTIIGQASATAVLAWLTLKDDERVLNGMTVSKVYKNAILYSNFPKYTAWQGFFDVLNSSGTVYIISIFLGSNTLGLYSFTLSLLQKPLQLIGGSVSQVYYQKASELYNAGNNIWNITLKLILKLLVISIIIFAPIAISGPKLFSFAFGKEWAEAGVYAQVLLPWIILRFIGSPITSSVNIISKQKAFFYLTLIINISFPLIIFYCLKYNLSFSVSLFIVSVLTSIYLCIIIIWIRHLLLYERIKNFK